MRTIPYLVVAGFLLAAAAVTTGAAQEPARATPQVRAGTAPAPDATYMGVSINGNFQEALEKALSNAQAGVAKSTNISDAQFNFRVIETSGRRGGLMGTQELTVKIQVLGGLGSPH